MGKYHKTLNKQIKKYLGKKYPIDDKFEKFLLAVNTSYLQSENENILLERAMDLSSREITETNQQLSEINIHLTKEIEAHQVTVNKLLKAKKKAEESDKLKYAFISNMSHKIRTPLNSIIGFSQLLTLPKLSEDQKNLYNKNIRSGARSLTSLIDDIIDMSKIESGLIEVETGEFYIDEIIEELYQIFFSERKRIEKEHVKLIKDIPKDSNNPIIITDPLRIKQVLVNLIGNAFKFTDKGHVKFGYKLIEEKTIQIFVEDTGIGIKKEKQDKIFNIFMKVSENDKKLFRGTGLGLALSKSLVNILGSNLNLCSEESKGSVFRFTAPLK